MDGIGEVAGLNLLEGGWRGVEDDFGNEETRAAWGRPGLGDGDGIWVRGYAASGSERSESDACELERS